MPSLQCRNNFATLSQSHAAVRKLRARIGCRHEAAEWTPSASTSHANHPSIRRDGDSPDIFQASAARTGDAPAQAPIARADVGRDKRTRRLKVARERVSKKLRLNSLRRVCRRLERVSAASECSLLDSYSALADGFGWVRASLPDETARVVLPMCKAVRDHHGRPPVHGAAELRLVTAGVPAEPVRTSCGGPAYQPNPLRTSRTCRASRPSWASRSRRTS